LNVVETVRPAPSTTVLVVETASATASSVSPMPTETASPTTVFTPTATLTPEPPFTLTLTATLDWPMLMKTRVHVYLVNVIDADACNYEVLPVPVPSHPKTGDMLTDIEWALRNLFVTKVHRIGYLTNPLAFSSLSFERISIDGRTMNVYLSGTVVQTESICNDGQARDQVFSTIRQYIDDLGLNVVVWVGEYLLDDLLWR
jgi:hypothetical protein